MLRAAIAAAPAALLAMPGAPGAAGVEPDLSRFTLPDGFAIEVFAPDVPNARQMAPGDDGTLFVGTKSKGRVWALRTRDGHLVGRPVDLLVLPDGSMLVSDDHGGRIYRISWHGSD